MVLNYVVSSQETAYSTLNPSYKANSSKELVFLKTNFNMLMQHITIYSVCGDVSVNVAYLKSKKEIQIFPIEKTIDFVVGLGEVGTDSIKRDFMMVSCINKREHYIHINGVSYVISEYKKLK